MANQYPHPPPPRRGPSSFKVIAVAAVASLAVIALVALVTAIHNSATNAITTTPSDAIATSAPVNAVCQPETYEHSSGPDTPNFEYATYIASCTANIALFSAAEVARPGDEHGPLWVVQFPSPGAAQDEVARQAVGGATAVTTISGKAVMFFAPADFRGVTLQPLAQSGIRVNRARACC
jgi:hypothetical protein